MTKKFIIPLIFFVCSNTIWASPEQWFKQANDFYAKGQYQEACNLYLQIEKAELVSFELFYNLGNTYYRLNQIGNAILYYEKAKKINPTDPDLLQNLRLAHLRTIDKIEPQELLFFEKLGLIILNLLTPNGWAYLTVFLLFLATLFFILNRLIIKLRTLFAIGSLIGFALFILSIFVSWRSKNFQQNQNTAVIVSSSVNSYSEPNQNSSLLFTLHEGTLVKIKDEEGEWCRIELPTGVSGWIPQMSLAKV